MVVDGYKPFGVVEEDFESSNVVVNLCESERTE